MNSSKILTTCIQRINDERSKRHKAIVVDRNKGRKNEFPRNLFVSSAAYKHGDNLYKCRIALIRDNKIPMIVNKDNYMLQSFDQLGDHMIAETTNFYIDTSGLTPIVCCEFNSQGPRISDIEYYFRKISGAEFLYISHACKAAVHMNMPVNEVLSSITDIYRFDLKARPSRLSHLYQGVDDAFVTNMNRLASTIDPHMMKVDAFFRTRGNQSKTNNRNNKALGLVKRILNAVRDNSEVIDDIEDFTLEYEKEDGSPGDFSLIRGKAEIEAECGFKTKGNLDTKELYNKVYPMFKDYIESYRNDE